ncbi:MAG: rhodanese-like domain-containing protein [Gammaproteobacteria bacterium]|nr:rhodanese-like domain-containing protein [Gammaproteobacteria bacterium]MDX2487100.1 rhodanese-like domain-containing protein [Gammaproteobacteria bacterium]
MITATYKALVQACLDSEHNRVDEIMPWDLAEMLETKTPLLLDVREPDEFNVAHIANSISVPRGVLESACEYDYEETEPELVTARERDVVVICRSGYRSVLACSVMQMMGYRSVVSLKTGIKGWNDYDQPLFNANDEEMDADDTWEMLNLPIREDQKSPV